MTVRMAVMRSSFALAHEAVVVGYGYCYACAHGCMISLTVSNIWSMLPGFRINRTAPNANALSWLSSSGLAENTTTGISRSWASAFYGHHFFSIASDNSL
jgi:hypothetical protein